VRFAVFVALVACSKGSERPPDVTETPPTQSAGCGDEKSCLAACDAGTNAACDELTSIYLRAKRRTDAAALTRRLCEGGRTYFCPSFAFALALGDGVPVDRERARELFERTCKDDPKGCSEFGNLLTAGRGVPLDVELGSRLLELACDLHDNDACRELQAVRAR
jgi:TPR repeat protein